VLDNLSHHEPIEKHSYGRQVLLDRQRGMHLCQSLNVAGHMRRPDLRELAHVPLLAPCEKIADIPKVRGARVRIPDLCGKKFQKPIRALLALWELPWNRLQKPLACPAKPLKTLGGVLNPVSFSRQFPKSHPFPRPPSR
jgi:hypothetical protein